jgi:hypothetical protein
MYLIWGLSNWSYGVTVNLVIALAGWPQSRAELSVSGGLEPIGTARGAARLA